MLQEYFSEYPSLTVIFSELGSISPTHILSTDEWKECDTRSKEDSDKLGKIYSHYFEPSLNDSKYISKAMRIVPAIGQSITN